MKKIIIVVFVVIVVGFFSYISFVQTTTISPHLSDRSKQYIEEQKRTQHSVWSGVNFESKNKFKMTESEVLSAQQMHQECFNLTIPYEIELRRQLEGCNTQIHTTNPKATIVVTVMENKGGDLSAIAAIQLRRNKADIYQESSKYVNGREYIVFEKQDWTYEKTAFTNWNGDVVTLTLSAPSNRKMNTVFDNLLSSFEYLL